MEETQSLIGPGQYSIKAASNAKMYAVSSPHLYLIYFCLFNFMSSIIGSGAFLLSYAADPLEFVTHYAFLWPLELRTFSWFHDPIAPLAHENSPPQSLAPRIPKVKVVWWGHNLGDYMAASEAENHQQSDEYIVKFRTVSGDTKDGRAY